MGHVVFEMEVGTLYCRNGNMQQPSLDGKFLIQLGTRRFSWDPRYWDFGHMWLIPLSSIELNLWWSCLPKSNCFFNSIHRLIILPWCTTYRVLAVLVVLESSTQDFLQVIKWEIQFAIAKQAPEWCIMFPAAPVRGLGLIAALAGFPSSLRVRSGCWERQPTPSASTDLDTLLSSLLGPLCHSA